MRPLNSSTKIGNLLFLAGTISLLAFATIPSVFAQLADGTWKLFTDPGKVFSTLVTFRA